MASVKCVSVAVLHEMCHYTCGRCEMKLKEDRQVKTLRHFGHNATHWWVTKGCGGWFFITACRHQGTPQNSDAHPTATVADVQYTVKGGQKPGETGAKMDLQFADLNSGALMSLISWLKEQDTPIQHKLVSVFVCVCVHACMHTCVCVSVCLCTCLCVCGHMHVYHA